jgi:hypothetical protein
MTLHSKRSQANRWLAHQRALAYLGDEYLLAVPSPRLSIKPKRELTLWQTEHGNGQRQKNGARLVNVAMRTLASRSA